MCGFWYDYVKPKYGKNAKLYYMDTYSFIVFVKADGICNNIAENAETRFDTSNFEIDRPLPKGKNKKVTGLMKNELVEQIMKEFAGLRTKAYSYLKENNDEDKKQKVQKNVIKRKLKFQDCKTYLKAAQIDGKIKYLEKKNLM